MTEVLNGNIVDRFQDKDDPEFDKKCSEISQDLKTGKYTILFLIEELGKLLTDTYPSKRELGILVLTEVLGNLPVDLLNNQQLKVITAFYIDKLKDHHQILPGTIKGLLNILKFHHFPEQTVPILLNTLFQNVSCQQQQQVDRCNIYLIFEFILNHFHKEVLGMGMDFVYGVISSIDGERDPRNLLFLFKWLKSFIQIVNLGHLTEEMFEVIACYFPVDFKAPSNELSITRESLANALCPCLCSTTEFGELCMSLALEKLDSSLEMAKIDSLKLLKEGCKNFDASVYLKNSTQIWIQLYKEILTNPNHEIKKECFETLTVLIAKISNLESKSEVKLFLKDIFDTVKRNLLPDAKLFELSADVLLYTANGSEYSSSYVTNEAIPLLTNTFNITGNPKEKSKLLKYLIEFTKSYIKYHENVNIGENNDLSNVPVLCLKATLDVDTTLQAIGYLGLTDLAPYLYPEIRKILYKNLQTLIVTPTDLELRRDLLNCFKNLCVYYEEEIREQLLSEANINDVSKLDLYLNAFGILMDLPNFRDFVIDTLLSNLSRNTEIAVKNIKELLEQTELNPEIPYLFLEKDILSKLLNKETLDVELLLSISSILKLLIGSQDCNIQRKFIEQHLQGVLQRIEQSDVHVILLDGLISRIHRDINLEYQILDILFTKATRSHVEVIRDTSVQLLANALNKKDNDETFKAYVDTLKNTCLQYISIDKNNSIITLLWITKALLMKKYPEEIVWIDLILNLLDQYPEVADNIQIVIDDDYISLSEISNCRKTLLYQQKFFVYVVNKIVDSYSSDKPSYLKAIGHLIQVAPQQVVFINFKKISRLVLLCLEKCYEIKILSVLLRIVKTVVTKDADLLENHLEDFLDRILKLTTFEESMIIRIEALQCLNKFSTSFPVYKLLPFKWTVLNQLGICIDDKKRLVRKEAMDTRSLWFILDAPI